MSFVFGNHARMKDLERRIGSIAQSGLPVLIEGESGTGKEAVAELLHGASGIDGQFTRIICRKLVPVAYPDSPGASGTVFLKSVHLLSVVAQEQLLAALEQQPDSHDRERGSAPASRLVSSAAESMEALVSRSEFNPTLYHRLSVYRIYLPPLRERREDIPELFEHLLHRVANGGGAPPKTTARLLDSLIAYDWPGNLRELQNIARTYVVAGHAQEIIWELISRSHPAPDFEVQRNGRSLKEQVKGASQKLESEIILRTLQRHQWNRRRTAESLHISYRSLLYKIKNCNLRIHPEAAPVGKREQ